MGRFFRNHKILSRCSVVIVLVILIPVVWLTLARIGVSKERNYPDYIKGVWEPAFPYFMAKDTSRIKNDNINTISLGPAIHMPGWLAPETNFIQQSIFVTIIKKAKAQGIAVHIAPQIFGPGPPKPEAVTPEKLAEYSRSVISWAKFAEKYKVEYFSPLNETDAALGGQKAVEWHKEILPKIRAVYSGKIYAKWGGGGCIWKDCGDDFFKVLKAGYDERIDASRDFDGMMVDPFLPDNLKALEEFYQKFPQVLEEVAQKAHQNNLPIIIGEFSIPTQKPKSSAEIMPGFTVDEQKQAEIIGKYLDIALPRFDGVIYCGWTLPGYGMRGKVVEEVIRQKFSDR